MGDPNFESAMLIIKERDAIIERLRAALKTTVDALEALRRGHGAEVSGLCYPALNVGRAALEQRETETK